VKGGHHAGLARALRVAIAIAIAVDVVGRSIQRALLIDKAVAVVVALIAVLGGAGVTLGTLIVAVRVVGGEPVRGLTAFFPYKRVAIPIAIAIGVPACGSDDSLRVGVVDGVIAVIVDSVADFGRSRSATAVRVVAVIGVENIAIRCNTALDGEVRVVGAIPIGIGIAIPGGIAHHVGVGVVDGTVAVVVNAVVAILLSTRMNGGSTVIAVTGLRGVALRGFTVRGRHRDLAIAVAVAVAVPDRRIGDEVAIIGVFEFIGAPVAVVVAAVADLRCPEEHRIAGVVAVAVEFGDAVAIKIMGRVLDKVALGEVGQTCREEKYWEEAEHGR
jgi:hypothetical protein